jgi:hypothetical protein
VREELESFRGRWPGGYHEGDPLDPVGASSYQDMGFLSVLYVIYRYCIKPRVNGDVAVVEVGPGRGAWTRTMLPAREVWCLDAVSAEENRFWEYVGVQNQGRVRYIKVDDFSCRDLPDDHFDFLFSFGAFCHISLEGQRQYYTNLLPKMKRGAEAFVHFADFDKYNTALRNASRPRVVSIHGSPVVGSLREAARHLRRRAKGRATAWDELEKGKENLVGYVHGGVRETAEFLRSVGWEIIEPDIGLNLRDPIVHFRKP